MLQDLTCLIWADPDAPEDVIRSALRPVEASHGTIILVQSVLRALRDGLNKHALPNEGEVLERHWHLRQALKSVRTYSSNRIYEAAQDLTPYEIAIFTKVINTLNMSMKK